MSFLFVDRILSLQPGEYVRGVKHVTPEDYYCAEEQDRRYLIPAFIGETLGQLAAWNVMVTEDFKRRPVAGIANSVRIFRPAYVGETIILESFIDTLDEDAVRYHSAATINNEVIFEIEGAIGPLLPMQDFIDEEIVRRQYVEIYRPHENINYTLLGEGEVIDYSPSALPSFRYDIILASTPCVSLAAVKRISRSAPYLPDHFPNMPVLPMTVLLTCKEQLIKEFLKRGNFSSMYRVFEMRRIKMSDFIRPGDVVLTELVLKKQDEHSMVLHCQSEVDGKRVCTVEFYLTLGNYGEK